MASKYWIKLYHEILHDPKMGRMCDKLWRRAIEFFLLAGEHDQNGELPPVDEICWTLRISAEECNVSLQELQRLGVAHCNDSGTWVVTHFSDRQSASTSTERSRAFRQRTRQDSPSNLSGNNGTEGNDNRNKRATKKQRNVAPDTDKDTDKDRGPDAGKKPDSPLAINKQMFAALAKICKIDWRVATNEQKGALNQSEKLLRVEVEAKPDDLPEFEKWWYKFDWRGKGGSPPTPNQVRETWGQFADYRSKHIQQQPISLAQGLNL